MSLTIEVIDEDNILNDDDNLTSDENINMWWKYYEWSLKNHLHSKQN